MLVTYIGIVIGFISLIIIQPRFLTTEEIGLTRVLFSFSALVATFMPFGMNSITLKYFPIFRDRDKKHYGFFGLMLLLPAVGFVVIGTIIYLSKDFIIGRYIEQSRLFTEYFFYIFPLTLFLSYSSVLNAYSFSLFKTTFPSFLNDIIIRVLSIVLFTLYFIKVLDLDQFIQLFVGIYGLQLIVLVIYIFIIDKPGMKIDKEFLQEQQPRAMMKYGLLLSFAALSSLGLKFLDTVMLGQYVPLALVGIYAVVAFIPTVIEAPLVALEKIGVATISNAWAKNNMDEIKEVYFKSSRYLFLIGGLLYLGINLNIETLLHLMPKSEYILGLNVVFIISAGNLANMATGINDSIIYTSDKYIYGTYMLIILFVVAFINNIIFIPMFGIEGAALATALSALIFNLMKYFFIWKSFGLQPLSNKTLRVASLIVITWIFFRFIPHYHDGIPDIILRSFLIFCFYVAGTIVLNIVPELYSLIPFLKNRKNK